VKLENFTVFQDQRRVSASPQEKLKGRKCGEERQSATYSMPNICKLWYLLAWVNYTHGSAIFLQFCNVPKIAIISHEI